MRFYGFNFLWMFSYNKDVPPQPIDKKALDFLNETGFNFVRLPCDYRFLINDSDYFSINESAFEFIDSCIQACKDRKIHLNINLHRAPGYCINGNKLERHNLWVDTIAQDAFVFLWEFFSKRYSSLSSELLSFGLVNEPPNIGQYRMTRENHEQVIRRAVNAIRSIDPERLIIIDGLGCGHLAVPELADLDVIHSGRGYQPMAISHCKATWWPEYESAPENPEYPNLQWQDKIWNRDTLLDQYKPWREVDACGRTVMIGECGCFNKTPNDVALRWLTDLFGIYSQLKWGYALWNFKGSFGIIEHGRPGAVFENYLGYEVDRKMLDLLINSRVNEIS